MGAGDAVGAAVEFMTREEILHKHPPDGVTGPNRWTNDHGLVMPAGSITDDTQMTVATAAGLLDALADWRSRGVDRVGDAVWARYRDWLSSQQQPHLRRYPGNTCLSALEGGTPGDLYEPLNDSKGSGTVMRVAPVALAYTPDVAFERGAEIGALTHGHSSATLAAGFFAQILSRLVRGPGAHGWSAARGGALPGAIAEAREALIGWDDHDEVLETVDAAVELYMADATLDDGIAALGQGWVAEEALGIALFCALNHPDDLDEAVLAAVNITGDSDTTGSMTGALLGAAHGEDAIPPGWLSSLEMRDTLACLADQLYSGYVEDGPASAASCLG